MAKTKMTKAKPARERAAKPVKPAARPAKPAKKPPRPSPNILPVPKRILTPVERSDADVHFRFYPSAPARILFSFTDAPEAGEYEVRLMELDAETGSIVATHAVNSKRHGRLFALSPFTTDVILSARRYQGPDAPVEWVHLEHDANKVGDEARHLQAITYRDDGRAAIVICAHAM
jgi:hypothetical protein